MSQKPVSRSSSGGGALPTGPWVIDTRDVGRRPGMSRRYHRSIPAPDSFSLDMIGVPRGEEITLDVRVDSVMEGVLVAGTASAPLTGECSRCLEPIEDSVEVEITELFAYPDSATEQSTDPDEVSRMVDELVDLEPVVRDALLLSLPSSPLCAETCQGLCVECGRRWAELEPGHRHETIDPRWAALLERTSGQEDKPEEN
ncbi:MULTISPECIES: YceD family protein [Actinoalloteichus]|nr:YceD family protein [Actinoalloteichus caeruleus]